MFVHKDLISQALVNDAEVLNRLLNEEFEPLHNEGSLELDYSQMQVFPIPLKDNKTISFSFSGKYKSKSGSSNGASFLAKLFVRQEPSEPYHIFKN